MDIVSKEVRSRMMGAIRGSNTTPEMKIRKLLHKQGFRFRLHPKDLPGRPDVVLPRYRLCIFVHGCFWHRHPGCRFTTTPKTRPEFWQAKFDQNIGRDLQNRANLLSLGWRVFEIWECGIHRPVTEMDWLPHAIRDCNQKHISWPTFPEKQISAQKKSQNHKIVK
ncbi:very short patch repair endonuclease [Pseudomonas sp. CC120222-01a]|uniref:very short patch repair endonuclease n=1 Tax=Pseudomonas sp. CC120222-01a TaxID=1378075 RepID=UPI000DA1627C|nr:very short patch repair endonuclease [Pseudomonas sp. CC120222-01a]